MHQRRERSAVVLYSSTCIRLCLLGLGIEQGRVCLICGMLVWTNLATVRGACGEQANWRHFWISKFVVNAWLLMAGQGMGRGEGGGTVKCCSNFWDRAGNPSLEVTGMLPLARESSTFSPPPPTKSRKSYRDWRGEMSELA